MLLVGCAVQQRQGLLFGQPRAYGQTIEVLQDVPIVTVKVQTAGSGWKVKITNHNNAPINFLVAESSYENPDGTESGLVRGEGSASDASSPVEIPVDGKHNDYLICNGQVSQDPYKIAKLKLVFEINGEKKTWVAAIRSGGILRMK